jgi:hypothetical protein
MWLVKILTNKNLREKERSERRLLLKANEEFLSEVNYLKKLRTKFKSEDSMKLADYDLKILMSINLDELIKNIKAINNVIPLLWVSPKDIKSFQKYIKNCKSLLQELITNSKSMKKIDTFKNLTTPNSIFLKTNRINFSFENFGTLQTQKILKTN